MIFTGFCLEKSDIILIFGAVVTSSIFQHIAFKILFNVSVTPIFTLLIWSPIISLLIFSGHYFFCKLLVIKGFKKNIVLDVLPSQRDSVIKNFSSLGKDFDYLNFLSKNDLREFVLKAEERDIDLIVISKEAHKHFEMDALLIRAHLGGIPIVDHTNISMTIPGRIKLSESKAGHIF